MTDSQIVRADAEIVRALAENVMHWRCKTYRGQYTQFVGEFDQYRGDGSRVLCKVFGDGSIGGWNPLERDSDACQVLDKMAQLGWGYMIANGCQILGKGSICCVFKKDDGRGDCYTEDRRRAICLASLKALGVDVGETVLRPSEEP